jgi:hypothetical protein
MIYRLCEWLKKPETIEVHFLLDLEDLVDQGNSNG